MGRTSDGCGASTASLASNRHRVQRDPNVLPVATSWNELSGHTVGVERIVYFLTEDRSLLFETTTSSEAAQMLSTSASLIAWSLLGFTHTVDGSVRETIPSKSSSKLNTESTACRSTSATVVASVKLSS